MRIGVDMDGVIMDSIGRWIEVLNREAGTAFRPGDLPETHASAELIAVVERHALEMFVAPMPIKGAVLAVSMLKEQGHAVIVITARTPRLQRLTEAWLEWHGLAVDGLHFLEGASKAPVAVAEGLDVMIDDAPHNALAVADAGVPVLLFGAPYNRAVRHPAVQRCHGWPRVMTSIRLRTGAERQAQSLAGGGASG